MKQNELSQSQYILDFIKPYSTLPHACYVSTLLCIHSYGIQHSSTGHRTFNIVSQRYFSFVHGTIHHHHKQCIIHTVLGYTLGRARLISLCWWMQWFTTFDGTTSMRRQYSNSLSLSIDFLQENHLTTSKYGWEKVSLGTATPIVACGTCQLISAKSFSPPVPKTQRTPTYIYTVKFTVEFHCCCIYRKTERLDKEVLE